MVVVRDGLAGPEFDAINQVVISDDGRHFAYAAEKNRSWRVVADGKPGPIFESGSFLRYQRNTLTYQARNADGEHVVVGNHFSPPFEIVGSEQVGDKGTFTYTVTTGRYPNSVQHLYINGVKAGEMTGPIEPAHILADGRVLYESRKAGHSALMLDATTVTEADDILEIAVSVDRQRYGFIARKGTQAAALSTIVVDGKTLREAGGLRSLSIGPSNHVAYTEMSGPRGRVVIDGVSGPTLNGVPERVVFNPDGMRHAYTVRSQNGMSVVVDGAQGPTFQWVDGLQFSPDSIHMAYSAGDDNARSNIVDGIVGPMHDWNSPPLFAAKSVLYAAWDDDEPQHWFMNGTDITADVEVGAGPIISPDGNDLTFVSVEGREILRRNVPVTTSRVLPVRSSVPPFSAPRPDRWMRIRVGEERDGFTFTTERRLLYEKQLIQGTNFPPHASKVAIARTSLSPHAIAMHLPQGDSGALAFLSLDRKTAVPIKFPDPPLLFASWSPDGKSFLIATNYEAHLKFHLGATATGAITDIAIPAQAGEEHNMEPSGVKWISNDRVSVPMKVSCNPYTNDNCKTGRLVVIRKYEFAIPVPSGPRK